MVRLSFWLLSEIFRWSTLSEPFSIPAMSFIIASSTAARDRLAAGARRLGIAVVRTTRNLGIDTGNAGRGPRPVLAARWSAFRARRLVINRILKTGRAAARVTRAGLNPAVSYGASVLGMPDARLRELDAVMHSALGPSSARSKYARLYPTGGPPSVGPATAPLFA